MGLQDLVFKVSSVIVYDPETVVVGVRHTFTVTNNGTTALEDLGIYVDVATNVGDVDNPAAEAPETDYQDILTWGSATDTGAAASGGLFIDAPLNDTAVTEAWTIDDPDGAPGPTVYADVTAVYNSAAASDVSPFAVDTVGNHFAIGYETPFSSTSVTVGVAGTVGAITVKYWDGAAWSAVAGLVDGTTDLSVSGTISFTMPTDWAVTTISTGASLYFIVIETDGNFGVLPLLSQGFITSNGKYITRTQGALRTNKIDFKDIAVGVTETFTVDLSSPPAVPARRLFINLVLE